MVFIPQIMMIPRRGGGLRPPPPPVYGEAVGVGQIGPDISRNFLESLGIFCTILDMFLKFWFLNCGFPRFLLEAPEVLKTLGKLVGSIYRGGGRTQAPDFCEGFTIGFLHEHSKTFYIEFCGRIGQL